MNTVKYVVASKFILGMLTESQHRKLKHWCDLRGVTLSMVTEVS